MNVDLTGVQYYQLVEGGRLIALAKAWECPRCHKINAPHVDRCDCKPEGGGIKPIKNTPYESDEVKLTSTSNKTVWVGEADWGTEHAESVTARWNPLMNMK